MVCAYCAAAIPEGQSFCPACFMSPTKQSANPLENSRQRNLIIFMGQPLAEFYHGRVLDYLQPDRVGWNFYALTNEAFMEMTSSSAGSWDLLIADAATVQQNADLLLGFMHQNPGVVVGIEYRSSEAIPMMPPIPCAVMFESPGEIDPWLLLMHTLLDLAERS